MRIDTHRHLGGSIPTWWVWQTIQDRDWSFIAENNEDVETAMTFVDGEPYGFHRFLDKFRILDKIQWDEELIDSSIVAICLELERERLDYCWMDFSINKYMGSMNWHKKEAIQFIRASFEQHRPRKVGLVLSLKYESMRASQRQYARLIEDPDIADCLFGLDLVGDEAYFDYEFYQPIFDDWNKAKKMTRAHVAESQDAINGFYSIKYLHATNIAHGLKLMELRHYPSGTARNQHVIDVAKDREVTFDLGISSNYLTNVWTDREQHPLNVMLKNELRVTLGTDDPVQCGSTLDGEFELAKAFGATEEQCQQMRLVAEENTKKYVIV